MSCTQAKAAWIVGEGIDFQTPRAYRPPDYQIPCGKCDSCRASKRREWGVRMVHEAQMHEQNSFLTITYKECPDQISREHAQRFIKRLRKESMMPNIRYFLTGEYGEKTRRPHYHAIIFGADFRGGPYTYNIDDILYGNKWLQSIWESDKKHTGGEIRIGPFTPGAAMYTAGYVQKKLGDSDTFSLMSKAPPLGKSWLYKHLREVDRLEYTAVEGVRQPIPPQYFEWALKEGWIDEDRHSVIKQNRRAYAEKQLWTPQSLKSRAINARAKLALKEEKI